MLNDSLLFGYRETVTNEQMDILKAITAPTEDTQIIIIEALAGTGKTFISTMGARLRKKQTEYIFAPCNEDQMGFLPGELFEKERPYLTPIRQALTKIREDPMKVLNTATGWIQAHSHTYDRGINYEDKTVIIDEAQNYTKHQLRKEITRCADNCKVIIMGNMKQCDLADPSKSGFRDYINHSYGVPWIKRMQLTHNFRGRIASWGDEI